MKLSEMKQFLAERGIRLTKSLGQNFLHDRNQLRRMLATANLRPTDKVLEIGPGLGPLTELLVQAVGEVLAIEKDARLVDVLRERFKTGLATSSGAGRTPVLQLVHDDALDYLRREHRDWSDWKLVANLPYSVASPILVELAQCERGPERIVATLQLEVAKRLVAGAADEDYGVLTLLTQLDYMPVESFRISATCFFPEPEVDSACVSLRRRSQALLASAQRAIFAQVVKRSFSQRRKMMLKLLKQDWPVQTLEAAFEQLRLAPQVRAEEVSLERFIRLTEWLSVNSKGGPRSIRCGQ
jgi:16S rRNA (adenine1518-N6/adenine1519-N6)-dimethyltransferase